MKIELSSSHSLFSFAFSSSITKSFTQGWLDKKFVQTPSLCIHCDFPCLPLSLVNSEIGPTISKQIVKCCNRSNAALRASSKLRSDWCPQSEPLLPPLCQPASSSSPHPGVAIIVIFDTYWKWYLVGRPLLWYRLYLDIFHNYCIPELVSYTGSPSPSQDVSITKKQECLLPNLAPPWSLTLLHFGRLNSTPSGQVMNFQKYMKQFFVLELQILRLWKTSFKK